MMAVRGGSSWRRAWHILWLGMLLLACGLAQAGPRVKVWGSPSAVLPLLRELQPDIDWQAESGARGAELHIAWQPEAYERASAAAGRAPILLLSQHHSRDLGLRPQDAALVWGPPLAQQLRLARRIMPLAKRIGVLYLDSADPSENWAAEISRVAALASQQGGVTLVPLALQWPISARALAEAADQVDILIASNDDRLFNRDSAKLILLTAYRHQRGIIGPTPAFVSAGAVASQAVPKSILLASILARVAQWQATGRLGDSQHADRFAPVLNTQVARSLGLVIAPDLLREAQP